MSRQNPSHHPSLCSSMTSIYTVHNCLLSFGNSRGKTFTIRPSSCMMKYLMFGQTSFQKTIFPPRFLFEKTFPTCLTLAHLQVGLIIMIIRAWLWPKFCLGHTSYICYYNHPGTPAGSPQCRHCLHGASPGIRNWMGGYSHLKNQNTALQNNTKLMGYKMSSCCRGQETS